MSDLFNNPLFYLGLCSAFLVICVGPILTALTYYFWYSTNFKKANNWKLFANKHGLQYSPPNPFLWEYGFVRGQFEGRGIFILPETLNRLPALTMVRVRVSDTKNFSLFVGQRGLLFGSSYASPGGSTVAIEGSFDEIFVTHSNSPQLAAKILQADNGLLLTEIKAFMLWKVLIKDNFISISIRENYADEAKLLRLIRLVFRLSEVFEHQTL